MPATRSVEIVMQNMTNGRASEPPVPVVSYGLCDGTECIFDFCNCRRIEHVLDLPLLGLFNIGQRWEECTGRRLHFINNRNHLVKAQAHDDAEHIHECCKCNRLSVELWGRQNP